MQIDEIIANAVAIAQKEGDLAFVTTREIRELLGETGGKRRATIIRAIGEAADKGYVRRIDKHVSGSFGKYAAIGGFKKMTKKQTIDAWRKTDKKNNYEMFILNAANALQNNGVVLDPAVLSQRTGLAMSTIENGIERLLSKGLIARKGCEIQVNEAARDESAVLEIGYRHRAKVLRIFVRSSTQTVDAVASKVRADRNEVLSALEILREEGWIKREGSKYVRVKEKREEKQKKEQTKYQIKKQRFFTQIEAFHAQL